jgi:sulfite exporter TauE/SafE
MELWTAFITGLVGSLHCIGMCGPIALALPQGFRGNARLILSRTLYNFGRVLTYSLMGALIGLAGLGVAVAGYQQALSIGLGVILLVTALLSVNVESRFISLPLINRLTVRLKIALGKLLRAGSQRSLFMIGILNGFLPCGFVYLALAGAATTGNVGESAAYMALFGFGTIPLMLATSVAGSFIKAGLRRRIQPFLTAFIVFFAVLLIVRGLNLGIPYLSPKIGGGPAEVEQCD